MWGSAGLGEMCPSVVAVSLDDVVGVGRLSAGSVDAGGEAPLIFWRLRGASCLEEPFIVVSCSLFDIKIGFVAAFDAFEFVADVLRLVTLS